MAKKLSSGMERMLQASLIGRLRYMTKRLSWMVEENPHLDTDQIRTLCMDIANANVLADQASEYWTEVVG